MALWSGFSFLQRLLGGSFISSKPCMVRVIRNGEEHLASFKLEVANTLPRRAKGLMGRDSLNDADGMLFVYPWPRTVRIWMAGTPMPLDAVFIDRSGVIVKIAADMQPNSRKWVSSGQPVKWVLEIAGGRAGNLGIVAGDRIELGHS